MNNISAAIKVNEMYSNLVLIAIQRGYDLGDLLYEVDTEIDEFIKSKKNFGLPVSYTGFYYIEMLANKMGSSIGELYSFTEYQREGVISDILKKLNPISMAYDTFFDDDDEDEKAISFGTTISIVSTRDEKRLGDYYRLDDKDVKSIYAFYDIYFVKTYETENSKSEYSISITVRDPGLPFNDKYIFPSVEVWSDTEGEFASFIDKAIKDHNKKAKVQVNNTAAPKEEAIDFKSFFVYGGNGECSDKTHNHQEKVMATVPILKKNMTIENIEFEAWYCPECNTYYISNKTYNSISNQGRLLCQLMSSYEYAEFKKQNANNSNLSPQSILNMLGYNVGSKDDFSAKYRQSILESAIETGIITKKRAIEYLEFFVRMNERNSSKKNAVSKWKEDIRYLRGTDTTSKGKTRLVGIKRIISNEKKPSSSNADKAMSYIDEDLPFK